METQLDFSLKMEDILTSSNVCDLLDEEHRKHLANLVVAGFETDMQSREAWEKRTEGSMKLALQVVEKKSFPWPGASNIKFPLITIAALQCHARMYPVLISGDTPVKCRVTEMDEDGSKTARAERIENHMSYQILEEDEDWEQEMDKVLITQPIIGCAFKKTFFHDVKKIIISENVLAKDLVVNYWTKSLETAPRITHILYFSKNDVYERVARGLWHDVDEDLTPSDVTNYSQGLAALQDKSQGSNPPDNTDISTPFEILEMHTQFDLDGDGYEEPYICWVRKDTKKLARIVPAYVPSNVERKVDGTIIKIKSEQYFTKFPFIPSPDGGFYDLGFGVLLGPLNESINTIINQLVDCGTMANTAGGFLSKGIKLRGGNYSFAPLEWKHVDTTGDDLKKGIMPLPVREPSQVLFTLLNLLIGYGERIGSSVDILSGVNPGQNTPAETSRTMTEQGLKVFNGIFKRTYRSLKAEFKKRYRLNQLNIKEQEKYSTSDAPNSTIYAKDYEMDSSDIAPSADPNVTSDEARLQRAIALKVASRETPGYNRHEVEKIFLKAMHFYNVDTLFPDPLGKNPYPPIPNPKVVVENIKAETKKAEMQIEMKLGLMKLLKEAELNQAKIEKLLAEAEFLKAEASNAENLTKIKAVESAVAMHRDKRDGMLEAAEMMRKIYETMHKDDEKPAAPAS